MDKNVEKEEKHTSPVVLKKIDRMTDACARRLYQLTKEELVGVLSVYVIEQCGRKEKAVISKSTLIVNSIINARKNNYEGA